MKNIKMANFNMDKHIYYLLSFTWGFLMTFIGIVAAFILLCKGHRPICWGRCICFHTGRRWGGVSLGLVIITDCSSESSILNHEHGHSIQNAIYGVFFPFIVAIPSAIRYQYRRFIQKYTKRILPPYDSIWFERQATEWGNNYIEKGTLR
jgi:hypothetical protein